VTLSDSSPGTPNVTHRTNAERNGSGPGLPTRRPPRNWKTYTVVGLLIVVPFVYLVISALQSRDSGRDKADRADDTRITRGWPSKVQRRIYDVPIPRHSSYVYFFETNRWSRSSLFVEFRTSPKKLDTFLKKSGTKRSELREGYVPINKKQTAAAAWTFQDGGEWSGVMVQQKDPKPDLAIAVDLMDKKRPQVRVVSTADF
jgi:hypothetical protein